MSKRNRKSKISKPNLPGSKNGPSGDRNYSGANRPE